MGPFRPPGWAALSALCFGVLGLGAGPSPGDEPVAVNQLSAAERAEGWRLLFDGRTSSGWRGYRAPGFPSRGWVVEEGCLKHQARGGGGDIITEGAYDDYELRFEWSLAPKANSGVKYLVVEARANAPGHEYQLVDDANERTNKPGDKHQTASFYDVLPPSAWTEPRPPGQFNESRIRVEGRHVEHWLNGTKILEYELGSEAVRAAVGRSKFRNVRGFGEKVRGHILLQDHGGEVRFRNMKLRELPAPAKVP